MTEISEQLQSAKENVTEPLPTPPDMDGKQAEPNELLERLNWGEPALTIADVRDRTEFNKERITGAVPMPMDQLPQSAEPLLEYNRDIYVYGDNAAQAAGQLRQAGFKSVSVLQGGLAAWKAIGGPTEGTEAFSSPKLSANS
ncbi:rhodanese-like domain-containing protein [Oscillatoria sp. CS-180]|uniref:rhodanese-like domain-containing protein n=1 Tax=Oscillatoria sp. CS-180 TaxID=3021720 RepID=UPI00232D8002|nr:rhodanese-like domain-containing protein [Oscillatoria sp. CS-180]MDB9528954.1 rhodanese-like domain-containing protein [Oscillatoria sp. CS-180]